MRDDHGGNLRALAVIAGVSPDQLLDFSANINPLGLSPRMEEAIRAAIPAVVHYPDPNAWGLRNALAAYHHLSPDYVLPANGSTELIYLLVRALAPRRALILHPAFSEYEAALDLIGAQLDHELLDESRGFLPELSRLLPCLGDQDLIILANPNNPAGSLIPRSDLFALLAAAGASRATVVVDEAFIDFVEKASLKRDLARFPRLLLLRSLTKFFALPGLRVGYALACPELLSQLSRWQGPWSVNAVAEAAGIAALADREYQENTRFLVPRWREELQSGLQRFGTLRVFPGVANYLLVRLLDTGLTAPELNVCLLKERIAIRDCSLFRGLGPAFLRLAVRRPEENQALLEALKRCL